VLFKNIPSISVNDDKIDRFQIEQGIEDPPKQWFAGKLAEVLSLNP
jgi:hypothetical protein